MGLLNLFGKSKKKKSFHIVNLINVAKRDGNIDKKEIEYISHIGYKLGFSKKEIFTHFNNPASKRFELPSTPKEIVEQLYDLVAVMMIDNELDQKEIEYITSFGLEMGLDENTLSTILLTMMKEIEGMIDKENIRDSILKIAYRK